METPVLEIARERLAALITPPPRIVDVRTFGQTGLTILLEPEDADRFQIVIDVDPEQSTLHTHPGSRQRDDSSGRFASLVGGYVLSVSGARHDAAGRSELADDEPRIVRLAVRKPADAEPDARDWTLLIEWTGRSGNVRLLNRHEVVQETLRALGPQSGDPYAPPPPDPRPSIRQTEPDALARILITSVPRDWCKSLSRLRGVSRPIAWEALWSSMDYEPEPEASSRIDPIERLTERATRPGFDPREYAGRLHRRLLQLEDERAHGVATTTLAFSRQEAAATPRLQLYRTPTSLRSLLPAAIVSERVLESLTPHRVQNAPSDPMAMLANAYSILAGVHREESRRSHYERRFRSEMQRLQRLRQKVATEAGSAEDESRLRLFGEAILANLRTIKKGDATLVCDDWTRGPDAPKLEIVLDPARPATDSADQYFKRARRAAKGRPIRQKRIVKLDEAMAKLSMLESRLRDQPSLPDASAIETGMRDALRSFYKEPTSPDPGIPMPGDSGAARSPDHKRGGKDEGTRSGLDGSARRSKGEESRFHPREYTIRDGWKVIVGRSNEENDYVTHRLAKQEDYWFHASGVPGSHVVLKRAGRKDNPSGKAIEEAASIAAFYSKSRNSGKAPVIYTLKKYVHKPRKAKPGLASCTNEKTVMVAPMNPEDGITPEWIAED